MSKPLVVATDASLDDRSGLAAIAVTTADQVLGVRLIRATGICQAEIKALLWAMELCKGRGAVVFHCDNLPVVEAVKSQRRTRRSMRMLVALARVRLRGQKCWKLRHKPRACVARSDQLTRSLLRRSRVAA